MCPFRHNSLFSDPLGGNRTPSTRIWWSRGVFFNFFECAPFDITLFFRTLWGEKRTLRVHFRWSRGLVFDFYESALFDITPFFRTLWGGNRTLRVHFRWSRGRLWSWGDGKPSTPTPWRKPPICMQMSHVHFGCTQIEKNLAGSKALRHMWVEGGAYRCSPPCVTCDPRR